MFGPTSIMGYILVDLPVELGNDFWSFALKRKFLEYGPLDSLRGDLWLQHFCYYLGFVVLFTATRSILQFIDYIVTAGVRKLEARQALKKAKAEAIPPSDKLAKSDDLPSALTIPQILDPQNRLSVEFNTHEGQPVHLDLCITAEEHRRPVLHSFCSSEAIKNIAISKGPSKPVYHEKDDVSEAPLRIMCKIKFNSGAKILLIIAATKRGSDYPGWVVSDQHVKSQKYFPDASDRQNRQFLGGYY